MPAVDQATLAREGYEVHRGLFDASEMARVIAMVEEADRRNPHRDRLNRGSMRFASNLMPCSDDLRAFAAQPAIIDLVCGHLGPDVWVRWDQAVAKGPGAPLFPFHQDNGYSGLPFEHLQVWIALTAADADNGGLWVVPGSHRRQWTHEWVGAEVRVLEPTEDAVCVEAGTGDVVVFSSLTVHATMPNTTSDLRWAYVIEYVALPDFDPQVDPPYFVAARGGRPAPALVDVFPGREA